MFIITDQYNVIKTVAREATRVANGILVELQTIWPDPDSLWHIYDITGVELPTGETYNTIGYKYEYNGTSFQLNPLWEPPVTPTAALIQEVQQLQTENAQLLNKLKDEQLSRTMSEFESNTRMSKLELGLA